jgi:hypothetical protein
VFSGTYGLIYGRGWVHRLWSIILIGSVSLLGASRLLAVEPSFDNQGLTALRVDGVNVLKPSPPHLQYAVFEQTALDDKGIKKYTFTKVNESGKGAFNSASRTFTEEFSWGSTEVTYKPGKDRIDLILTISNKSTKTLADFEYVLGTFEFPSEPTGWKGGKGPLANSLDNLALIKIEASKSRFLICNASVDQPFVLGFGSATEKGKFVYPLLVRGGVSATEPGAYTIEPHGLPRIPPGKSIALEVTLRNFPANTNTTDLLTDVVQKFRAFNKPPPAWIDRRPIGMIIQSSPAKQHQSATNPRGWLNNPKLDIISSSGKSTFRVEMIKAAQQGVKVIKDTGGQGMIFWDVEGEENPHPITYIGDPSLAKKLAPEMDEIADDYFKIYRDAGLRTGVTLRPTQPYYNEQKKQWDHGTGSDGGPGRGDFYPMLRPKDVPWYKFYPIAERLSDKIAYAKKRWGCTLFYVDTNGIWQQVGEDQKFTWFLLEAQVWKRLRELHPDVLLIPELPRDDQTYHAAYWAYTAAYTETKMKGYRTPLAIKELFPESFSVVNIGDGDLIANRAEIKAGVKKGDILMFRGWFADSRNAWVKSLYQDAKEK